MFAIAFDLVVADTARNHPKGVTQAYADIRNALTQKYHLSCTTNVREPKQAHLFPIHL